MTGPTFAMTAGQQLACAEALSAAPRAALRVAGVKGRWGQLLPLACLLSL